MISKKKLLLNTNLYLIVSITDYNQLDTLYIRAQKALKAGIKILQLRCKDVEDRVFLDLAHRFRRLTKANNTLFIVNDRIDIAFICNADGVHLGQDDLPLAAAWNILGKHKIIGKSTHSLKEALQAQSERADYIGFGPIYKTKAKPNINVIGPDAIRLLIGNIKIPFFVLGGINQNNIKEIVSAGAERIAVSNAILSKRNSGQAVRNLQKVIKGQTRVMLTTGAEANNNCS